MNNKYSIINIETIQERIEGLKKRIDPNDKKENPIWWQHTGQLIEKEINILNEILSQSTPLIPEIEKAFESVRPYVGFNDLEDVRQEYINNLKLDI